MTPPDTTTDSQIDHWAQLRREELGSSPIFTSKVMRKIHAASPHSEEAAPDLPLPDHAPRPLMASLCLCAGMGKLALLIHLAF